MKPCFATSTTTEGSPWNFLFARAKEDGTKRNKNRPEGGTRNRKRDKEGWGEELLGDTDQKRNKRKKNQNLTEYDGSDYENHDENTANYETDYSDGDLSEYVGTAFYETAVPNEDFPEYSDPIPAPTESETPAEIVTSSEIVTPVKIVTTRTTSTSTAMPLSFEKISTQEVTFNSTTPMTEYKLTTIEETASEEEEMVSAFMNNSHNVGITM